MADDRKIIIEIVTGKEESDPIPNVTNNTKEETKKSDFGILMKSVVVNQAFQLAKKTVIQSVDIALTRRFSFTENYKGQQDYQNTKTAISKITGLGTSVVGGAVSGATLGGAGAVAGAVIGAVGWGVGEGFAVYERYSNQAQSLNASRYQTGFMGQRLGLTDGGKGTQN